MTYLLWGYLAAVNLLLFALMGIDKARARARERRIPEATLFLFALIGGSLGGTLGMFLFRHKTRHWTFRVLFPLFLLLHLALGLFLARRMGMTILDFPRG